MSWFTQAPPGATGDTGAGEKGLKGSGLSLCIKNSLYRPGVLFRLELRGQHLLYVEWTVRWQWLFTQLATPRFPSPLPGAAIVVYA